MTVERVYTKLGGYFLVRWDAACGQSTRPRCCYYYADEFKIGVLLYRHFVENYLAAHAGSAMVIFSPTATNQQWACKPEEIDHSE